jgi:hypothetical protein
MILKTKKEFAERDRMRAHMKDYLKPGDRVFVVLRKTGANHNRHMSPYKMGQDHDLYPIWADCRAALGQGSIKRVNYDEIRMQISPQDFVRLLGKTLYDDEEAFNCTQL